MFKALISFILILSSITNTYACSVAKTQNERGQMVVAKNFDWFTGEGIIVFNPRKRKRTSLNGSRKWTAKFASTSFTTVGPGFPVSSQNEKGLIVEALVDFDSHLSGAQKKFTSLGWAQYILDNFQSLDEVIKFAKDNPYTQIIVPLHFFICDGDQNCAVFESRGRGNNKIQITKGRELKIPVLANRGWKNDYKLSQYSFIKRYRKSLNPYSSGKRFNTLADEDFLTENNSQEDIFDQLQSARIPSINQWQIIWNPSEQSVSWKQKGSDKVYKLNTHHEFKCSSKHKIMYLDDVETYKEYTKDDAKKTKARVIETSMARRGTSNSSLAKKVSNFTLNAKCGL